MIVLINDVGSAHKINDSSFASAQLVSVVTPTRLFLGVEDAQ